MVGASNDNYDYIHELAPKAAGLKMYLNETFSTLTLSDTNVWLKVCANLSPIIKIEVNILKKVTTQIDFIPKFTFSIWKLGLQTYQFVCMRKAGL